MNDNMGDTIFARSSGAPPAGIAVIRVSGPQARIAVERLAGRLPPPRMARVALLRDPQDGLALDRALLLWLPGPATVTGEDMAEFHCHGGRAVIAAVEAALAALPGCRRAQAGEFTRRAFISGKMDLNAVEGLSDLLAAETQHQRRTALMMAEGHFSRRIEEWRSALLDLSAMAEAALDFSDEDDVPDAAIEERMGDAIRAVVDDVAVVLAAPSAERLRDGIRVVLAGPPNAGKSTLLNRLVGREAAIVSDMAGTTRDRIDVPVAINGKAYLFTDTAGLRDAAQDAVEAIGIDRARAAMEAADIIVWLGHPDAAPRADAIRVAAQCDRVDHGDKDGLRVSAKTGQNLDSLIAQIDRRAAALLPGEGEYALHARQKAQVEALMVHLQAAGESRDVLVVAEELRWGRRTIDALTGTAGTEDMLDRLFAGFCIGK